MAREIHAHPRHWPSIPDHHSCEIQPKLLSGELRPTSPRTVQSISVVVPPCGTNGQEPNEKHPSPGAFRTPPCCLPTIPIKPINLVIFFICLIILAGGLDASMFNSYGNLVLGFAASVPKYLLWKPSAMRWLTIPCSESVQELVRLSRERHI
ncbi:hypothetical protein DEU56DRAFT_211418 [Suillus clintonianus]|uniref:uncharacterized protein n=1 Tax=Suillus clintonianus TaxID=1904413 RepID=UPI001B85CBC7|nr:uncharacterized protein DEU56DRAFT_211418 [Suillus clintonianus]KAG2144618.1 hypothetical protein DEU56DRAFT_211418 [Suillus clintonianus]